jgi:anti-anti-sigma factor
MPLAIDVKDIEPDHARVTIALSGSLDTATSPQLETRLGELLTKWPRLLVFDLAGLTFLSSAGLRVFSIARKSVQERGGTVAMLHMQPQIAKVFEIVKSLPGFSIFGSVAEFDKYLAAMQKKFSAPE